MKVKLVILISTFFLSISQISNAQKIALSTNLVDWANFGTANLEAGMSVSQHFSFMLGGHYNPWSFQTNSNILTYNQQSTLYAGAKYWPWYVYSGWWIGAKVQYSAINRTGIWRPALESNKSIGAGFSFGYTIMLHKNLNLEFGVGLWGGRHLDYTIYECPKCMRVRETGARGFVAPDDVSVSLMYVF